MLLTAGATNYLNANPVHSPMMSLPLLAYTLVQNPEPNYIARGFGAAAALLILVLLLFVIMRAIGGRGAGQLTDRQRRRRMAASRRDAERFSKRRSVREAGGQLAAFGFAPARFDGTARRGDEQ